MARILVVDDDGSARYLVRHALETGGHTVVEATNGLNAMREHKATPADLVITDLKMPVLDGFETIFEFRRDYPSVPIIAYTSQRPGSGMNYLDAASQIGARHVLQAPFSEKELLHVVGLVLSKDPAPPAM